MKTVLIHESDYELAEIMAKMLETEGYKAIATSSAVAGERIYEAGRQNIDLIIVQIDCADDEGKILAKMIKKINHNAMIIGTCNDKPPEEEPGIALLLKKHFDCKLLCLMVESLLE